MTWKPVHEPRTIGEVSVQSERAAFTNEVAHSVSVGDRTLRVLPDGRTTSRKRSYIISDASTAARAVEGIDTLAYIAGKLILEGVVRLELDGHLLVPEPEARGEWQVTLTDDGGVAARFIGGDR